MGNFGSVSADDVVATGTAASVSTALPVVTLEAPSFVRFFVDACRSFGAVTGLTDDRDSNRLKSHEWFETACTAIAPTIHRLFHRKGQRSFVHNNILFCVLLSKEELRQFRSHMKGAELVQFLRVADVIVPECAMLQFLGLRIACIRLMHLHKPVHPADACESGENSAWSSRHATTTKLILSKVLRLATDPAVVFYESGDGRLVLLDASLLLPEHNTLHTAIADAAGATVRAEYLIGRDLGSMTVTPPSMVYSVSAPLLDSNSCASPSQQHQRFVGCAAVSYLSLVASSTCGRKRATPVPTLNALIALQTPVTVCLSDALTVASVAVPVVPVLHYRYHVSIATTPYAHTTHMIRGVLPSLAKILDDLPEDMGASEFVSLLHLAGVNISFLGQLYRVLVTSTECESVSAASARGYQSDALNAQVTARQRVALEMICRAAKHWLLDRMAQEAADYERPVLELLRGIGDPSFFEAEMTPVLLRLFGDVRHHLTKIRIFPAYSEISFRLFFERIQELTGLCVEHGRLKSVSPVVRIARRNFTLSSSDELSVCNVAAKRVDGFAGASLFAAASWWANNPNRLAKIVEQLHHRVAAAQQAASTSAEAALTTHMFLTELQFMLSRMVLFRLSTPHPSDSVQADAESRRRYEYVSSVLTPFIPSISQLLKDTPHDRLHLARQTLPLLDFLLRDASTSAKAAQLLRILIQLGLLTDPNHFHPVSSRNVADELYKLSIEALLLTKQHDEAVIVAQRWSRLCPLIFGSESKQCCRAFKLLLSALALSHSPKSEQLKVAKHRLHLCERVYGPRDIKTAAAVSELGSLTWKASPSVGLQHFRRSVDIYKEVMGPTCRPVCSALYNIGLALARLNRFRAAMLHLIQARSIALQLNELSTARMCEVSERTVLGVAALKIQRWYRENKYGQAQSQTTKTEDVTTKCSTLSWSDEVDEIASSTHGD